VTGREGTGSIPVLGRHARAPGTTHGLTRGTLPLAGGNRPSLSSTDGSQRLLAQEGDWDTEGVVGSSGLCLPLMKLATILPSPMLPSNPPTHGCPWIATKAPTAKKARLTPKANTCPRRASAKLLCIPAIFAFSDFSSMLRRWLPSCSAIAIMRSAKPGCTSSYCLRIPGGGSGPSKLAETTAWTGPAALAGGG
jgi:hypothetical protein